MFTHPRYGGPGQTRSWARLATVLSLLSLVLALAAVATLSGCRSQATPPRIIVLGIDGLDPVALDLLMSEGRLPNFAKLRQEGAYGRLESSKPILSPIIWTTIATGKPPAEHGIGHFVATNSNTGEKLPVTSQMRKVRAVWDIASEIGRKVAVVGWWATWPAESVNGVMVSDHTCYHFLFDEGLDGSGEKTGLMHPPEAVGRLQSLIRRPDDLTHAEGERFVSVQPEEFAKPFEFSDDLGHFKWALATAESYETVGRTLWNSEDPELLMVYIEGVDSTSHLFGHLFRAEGLHGELAEQQRRYGRAVEEMYVYADSIVGKYMELMDDSTTLVVLSDHGFELGTLHEDPSKTRSLQRVSERYHRMHGVLYLYGRGVVPRAQLLDAQLLDITPTLLALTGSAPARDMPGRVLEEAFSFQPAQPTVDTFERDGRGDAVANGSADASVDPVILEHLEALGYLDTPSPSGDRNMAAIHFQAGRFAEAEQAYRRLLIDQSEDGALHTSLAGALASQGRFDEALEELAISEKLQPLNPETYHNRAVLFERKGRPDAAAEQYRTALRYAPQYEPSRSALLRLTGSGAADVPKGQHERRADALARSASDQAKRGDYGGALATLDQAASIAPEYALVYQYRANVAFLMQDTDAAISAMQKAVALEPDNALYRVNLDRLRGTDSPDDEESR